jgi:hypothetical protein
MATHFGKEGVVTAGGTGIGELTGYTLETTADVVEDTQLSDAGKIICSWKNVILRYFRNEL